MSSIDMKEKQQDLISLQKELMQIDRQYKPILNHFKLFGSKTKAYLNGELEGGAPSNIFRCVHLIIKRADGLQHLKKEFEDQKAVKVSRSSCQSGRSRDSKLPGGPEEDLDCKNSCALLSASTE